MLQDDAWNSAEVLRREQTMKTPKHENLSRGASVVPVGAATVILVRDSRKGQFEVFLMRRHREQNFMGGATVFPGGRLDEADCDPSLVACVKGLSPADARERLQERDLTAEKAMGLFFAALRETFEESGVLLACGPSGELLNLRDGETAGRFAGYRLKLHEKSLSLMELAQRESIRYALDLLCPYSHWITPEVETRRFDTRFFLALHPRGQLPVHDTIEMTKSVWMTPAAALEEYESGKILLMPPTLKTVEELSGYRTTDELFAHARGRRIEPFLPQAFVLEDGYGIRLPYDPEYTIEAYKLPPRPGEPSSIVMKDGRWKLVRL